MDFCAAPWLIPAMRFSIVVPIGAWSPFLPAALRSLTLQEADLDVALCDASDDARVAEAADASGIAFAYRRHGPDRGQADAIAEGWANTSGQILGWLNADDVLLPGALADVASSFMRHPGLDVWFGQTAYFDEEGATIGRHASVAPVGPLLLRSCTISQPSCFARRSAVDAIGGIDRDRHYTMDWDLWSRLYRRGARFGDTSAYYSTVLINTGSKTSSLSLRRLKEVFAVSKAGAGGYAALKTVIGVALHHLATYSPLGSRAQALTTQTGGAPWLIPLPVLNLSEAPQDRLSVRLAGPGAASTEIRVGSSRAMGPTAEFSLPAPVPPGAAALLELVSGQAPPRLEHAGFGFDGTDLVQTVCEPCRPRRGRLFRASIIK